MTGAKIKTRRRLSPDRIEELQAEADCYFEHVDFLDKWLDGEFGDSFTTQEKNWIRKELLRQFTIWAKPRRSQP